MKASNAQYYTFLTFGYNGGLSNSQSVVNTFVNDYNKTRTYLDQKMNPQDFIQGFTGSWGYGREGIFFDIMYTNKYSMHTATGIPASSNSLQRRDVRFTFNTLSLCMYFVNYKHHTFRGPGLSVDFGKIKQRTRTGEAGTIEKESYVDIGINNSLGLTLCYDFKIKIVKGVFFGLRPYYQFVKSEANILSIAKNVNNVYSGSATKINGGNFGLQVNIGFGTYHYD